MKVKLLKKFRKQTEIYYSRKAKVISTDTNEEIKGRYVVRDPLNKINYYCDSLQGAIQRRRSIILILLQNYMDETETYNKKINVYKT